MQNLNTGCDKTSLHAVTFESNSRDNWLRGWNKTSLKAVARWAGDKKKKKTWIKTWGTAQWESLDINCEANGAYQTRGKTHALAPLQTPTGKSVARCQNWKWTRSPRSLTQAFLLSPPPPCFRLVHKVKRGLSLFAARANISSSYPPHSLTHPPSPPPPAPLHFRNGRGNTSGRRTHAPRRLPRGARHRLQTTIWRHVSTTTPVNCHLEKKILRGCCSLFSRAAIFTSSRPLANFLECGVFAWFVFCRGSTWNSRETRP